MRILLRGDSGFAREALMAWCEANRVDYLFGLARNDRLVEAIRTELAEAAVESMTTGKPARRFRDFSWSTLDSWSCDRRVIGKAEWTGGEANPRFVVTSLKGTEVGARHLYEVVYCARGEMENRIKECQLDLFADRTSAATMRANQLQAMVRLDGLYVALRAAPDRPGPYPVCSGDLRHHPLEATKDRRPRAHQRARVKIAMASAHPWQYEFGLAHAMLTKSAS